MSFRPLSLIMVLNMIRQRFAVAFILLFMENYLCEVATHGSVNDFHQMEFDPKGYIIYCPCMGRFGNQADHLLGSLAFARMVDRTIVLPPWPTNRGFIQFDRWFDIDVLKTYHKVITAEQFMENVAPSIWPIGQRVGFCFQLPHRIPNEVDCDMKRGSPFGPFWNHLNVNFDSVAYYNLTYTKEDKQFWEHLYPATKYPVIAFKGAPASFPVKENHVDLHRHLLWADSMIQEAMGIIYNLVGDDKYIAVHLRNGIDWERACQYATHSTSFMSSPQCTGYDNKKNLTHSMCLPTLQVIFKIIREAVIHTQVTNVYILTDRAPLLKEIEDELSDMDVKVFHGDPEIPQFDLIIASRAELFIGNCVSSFSAFVVRERHLIFKKPTWFFGVDAIV